MTSALSEAQTLAWLRGLLALAWSDGDFDEKEQALIADLTQSELAPGLTMDSLEPIVPAELAAALGGDPGIAENFLRTAVMVAIADGVYSSHEDNLLHEFCQALELNDKILQTLRLTLYNPEAETSPQSTSPASSTTPHFQSLSLEPKLQPLKPLQEWLDDLDVQDPRVARFLCKMIPPQCPFERDITLFGRKIVHIPPLCKLNPLYDQLVGLRFRSLSYLADKCGEDVSAYC